jgi:hypothetical protein
LVGVLIMKDTRGQLPKSVVSRDTATYPQATYSLFLPSKTKKKLHYRSSRAQIRVFGETCIKMDVTNRSLRV